MKYRQFFKSVFEVHGPSSRLLLGLEGLSSIYLEGILVCFDLSDETLLKASWLKSINIKSQVCKVLWDTLYLFINNKHIIIDYFKCYNTVKNCFQYMVHNLPCTDRKPVQTRQ